MKSRRTTLAWLTPALAALALVGAVSVDAARPPGGAKYSASEKGCIGQCPTLKITTTNHGKRFKFTSAWSGNCTSKDPSNEFGGSPVWDGATDGHGYAIHSNGRFRAVGSYSSNPPRTYGGPATAGEVHLTLKGRFTSAKRAKATVHVAVIGKDSSGNTVDKCTDTEPFVLKRH